jgi:F-type H+-transporting ATPase subunit delta
MSDFRIASRYAKALFEQAVETKTLDTVESDVRHLISVCEENRDFVLFLNSPLIKMATKKEAMNKMFASYSPLTLSLLMIMAEKFRESLIPGMTQSFIALVNKHKNIMTAEVTAAVEMTDADIKAVKSYVAKQTGATEVQLKQIVDSDVIGGINVVFDGKIYDSTVSNQLLKIKKDLQIA